MLTATSGSWKVPWQRSSSQVRPQPHPPCLRPPQPPPVSCASSQCPLLTWLLLRRYCALGPTQHEGRLRLLLSPADLPGDLGAAFRLPPEYIPPDSGGDPGRQSPCGGGARGGGSHPLGATGSLSHPQSAVTKVTAAHDRQQLWKANVGFIIQLQARLRGFLVRQKFAERSHFLRTWLPAVIKIQVAGSGLRSRQGRA